LSDFTPLVEAEKKFFFKTNYFYQLGFVN
jgi:hypothetical protein